MGAAVLGFGFEVADASMVTLLDMFAVAMNVRVVAEKANEARTRSIGFLK